ncbi:MAG: hypothetical protein ACJ760_05280 [Thermoleophilaceae bacterium]
MKLGVAIRDVAKAEERLAESLLEVGERHKADHDVYHLTRKLARWSQGHVAALVPLGVRYDVEFSADDIGGVTRRGPTLCRAANRVRYLPPAPAAATTRTRPRRRGPRSARDRR